MPINGGRGRGGVTPLMRAKKPVKVSLVPRFSSFPGSKVLGAAARSAFRRRAHVWDEMAVEQDRVAQGRACTASGQL